MLFFGKADAFLNKRADLKAAFDRFANQEVGFLLKQVADVNGFVKPTTNMRTDIDVALVRRFGSIERFFMPMEA